MKNLGASRRPEAQASSGAKFVLALALLVTAGCAIGYVMQMNAATAQGYQIRELERSVSRLESENAKLSASLSDLQSMTAKQGKIDMMGMVEVDRVDYLNAKVPRRP